MKIISVPGRSTVGMMGCNIKPGHKPGGFTTVLGAPGKRLVRRRVTDEAVKQAAEDTLKRHGVDSHPFGGDCRYSAAHRDFTAKSEAPSSPQIAP